MSTYKDHDARIYGDTTMCAKCGKQWDTNDPEPPPCISKEEKRQATGRKWLAKIRRGLNGNN